MCCSTSSFTHDVLLYVTVEYDGTWCHVQSVQCWVLSYNPIHLSLRKSVNSRSCFPFRDTGKLRKVEQRRCASVFLAWPDYEEAWRWLVTFGGIFDLTKVHWLIWNAEKNSCNKCSMTLQTNTELYHVKDQPAPARLLLFFSFLEGLSLN